MALPPTKLPRLPNGVPLVEGAKEEATLFFKQKWDELCRQLEGNFATLGEQNDAIVAAQADIIAAQADIITALNDAGVALGAANSAAGKISLLGSYPANYTAPLLSADAAGNVTVANHDRVYYDSTLNPTVSVTGGVIATGAGAGTIVRVYYDDASRAGGAVTFATTASAETAAQRGDRHSVGAVTIPGVGTANGNPLQPPGWALL